MEDIPQVFTIDNHLETCLLLEEMFSSLDIHSVFACTIKEADEMLSQITPAVIMINHNLPDGFGFDYIPQLRKKFPNCRIIAMSSNYDSQTKFHAFNSGANEFLEIPFSVNQLYKAVINPKTTISG